MSAANRDISHATALNIAGIDPMEAKHALHRRTTIMNKKNPYRWQERWQTLAIPSKRPKIGLTGSPEKVMK